MSFRKIIRILDFSSLASDSPNYEARTLKCLSRLQRSGRFWVRKNFAFVFCGRKAFGGNIIKPGYLIRFVPFPFCYTPKQLRPAEVRFWADSKGEICQFSEPRCFNTVKYCFISTRPQHSGEKTGN